MQRSEALQMDQQQHSTIYRMTMPEYWRSLSNPSLSYSEPLFNEYFGFLSLIRQWPAGVYELTLLQMYLSTYSAFQHMDITERLQYLGMSPESIAAFEAVKKVFALSLDNTMETAGLIVQCLMLDHMIVTKSLNIASVLPFIIMCTAGRREDLVATDDRIQNIIRWMSSAPWFIKRLGNLQTEHYRTIDAWYNTAFFDHTLQFVLDRGNVLNLKLSLILEMLLATTDPRLSVEHTFLDLLMRRLYEASISKTADGIRQTMIELDYSPFMIGMWNQFFPMDFQVSYDDLISFMIDTCRDTRSEDTSNSTAASPIHIPINVSNAQIFVEGNYSSAARACPISMFDDWEQYEDEVDGEVVQGVYLDNVHIIQSNSNNNDNSNNQL